MSDPIDAPTPAAIARAVDRLRAGVLVAFPTETVYGLGADAAQPGSRAPHLRRERPPRRPSGDRPLQRRDADRRTGRAPCRRRAKKLAAAFWPGPLTLILPRASHVADIVTGGQDSVGLRVPSHPVARELLAAFGGGIAAPSANRFGRISPTTAQHVADDLGDSVATILDGGACAIGIESTIVAFAGDRPGAAAARRHRRARAVARARAAAAPTRMRAAPRASGTLASHYAPRTPANLVAADMLRAEILQLDERDEIVAVLARTVARPADFAGVWLQAPADAAQYAHDLYANLRTLDAANADVILIETRAGRRCLAGRARPALPRDARRGRRSRLADRQRLGALPRRHRPANARSRNAAIAATSSFCRWSK